MFDTEGFVLVSSLCGVVGSPSWFTRFLIGRTGNILSVVYINAKCIFLSETDVFTIMECAIVSDFCHVTSILPFISWCSGVSNTNPTQHIEIPS